MKRALLLGVSAFSLAFGAGHALADNLPVQNLTFTQFNNGVFASQNPMKTLFTNADPVGWTGGTGLISIDGPGTATLFNEFIGNSYGVYGPFKRSPAGRKLHSGGRQPGI